MKGKPSIVRFAIIGCGIIADIHAKGIQETAEAELTALYDKQPEKAIRFAEEYGGKVYHTMEDLLAAEDIDVVCICTPSGQHPEQTIQSARAGKHVLVEKPMAIHLPDVERMIESCKRAGVWLSTVFPRRMSPQAQFAREVIQSGRLGKLSLCSAYVKLYRDQVYYDSAGWRGTWEMDGGGAMMNQGIHTVDLLQWLAGNVTTVTGKARAVLRDIEVEDTVLSSLQYESGALGMLEITTTAYQGKGQRLEIHGEKGTLVIEEDDIISLHIEGEEVECPKFAAFRVIPDGHRMQIQDMARAVLEQRPPIVTGEDGRHSLEIILRTYQSSRTGQEIRLASDKPIVQTAADHLRIQVYPTREEMGLSAAREAADVLRQLLREQERVRVVFAAAPSQLAFLQALKREPHIDWSRVTVFHMDEYVGLPATASSSFSQFLQEQIWEDVRPGEVHVIDGCNDPDEECARYSRLINAAPIDLICLGIGENGHIAFNDPPVADFKDPMIMKKVELDEACRQQQVNDGCFDKLDEVPRYALTLTVPTMMSGGRLFCIVPGERKHAAVRRMLTRAISTACPATILRRHPNCTLYADQAAYSGIADV
ncbi:Gfo/Idh/MocA family protein [Marinicrinis sediminis]|uniref:Gfo/Idh/MocA family oxidoreductase n=1 Tax=Marinicrinis sediminis TaxID=1652465 RepID=A0ABW5R9Y1_9BACL